LVLKKQVMNKLLSQKRFQNKKNMHFQL